MNEISDKNLISLLNALSLVEKLEEKNEIILGMEGFFLEENQIVPDMDMIADFSEISSSAKTDQEKSRDSILATRRVLNIWLDEIKGDRSIEFVLKK